MVNTTNGVPGVLAQKPATRVSKRDQDRAIIRHHSTEDVNVQSISVKARRFDNAHSKNVKVVRNSFLHTIVNVSLRQTS